MIRHRQVGNLPPQLSAHGPSFVTVNRMLQPLSSVRAGFEAIRDASAALLGARLLDPWPRRLWFLAMSAGLFVLGVFAPAAIALGTLVVALWLLLAVYFAWGGNENQRGRIAKKIDDTRPDTLPDLRDLALLTALAVPCFLPLVFEKAQECFDLFSLDGQPGPLAWLGFLLDKTYLRALPDVVDVGFARFEPLHGRSIDYLPGWGGYPGQGLVLLAYALVYLVLLQGLGRLWQIHRDVEEGVAGTISDPDMGVRLGRRAVQPLLKLWRQSEPTPAARANILTALGRIGDPAALAVLRESAVRHPEPAVREAALRALADLDNKDTANLLGKVLLDRAETVGARAAAAAALGRLSCPEAAEPLLTKLAEVHQVARRYHEGPNVRKEVVRAIGDHLGRRREQGEDIGELIDRAVRYLLADEKNSSLLEDVYLRVRNKAAGALARLGDERAILPLIERAGDGQYQNPKLVRDTLLAIGSLLRTLRAGGTVIEAEVRKKVLEELSRQLRTSQNDSVRQAAARALGMCAAVELTEELLAGFAAALKSGQEELAQALKDGVCAIDPEQTAPLTALEKRIGRLWSQRRRQTLLDGERELGERLKAAVELGECRDERGLKALRMTVSNPDAPEALRAACEEAVRKINAPDAL